MAGWLRSASVVGSYTAMTAGTLPTNWVQKGSTLSTNGLNFAVVGLGTANGMPYIDGRIFGTTTAASTWALAPENSTQIAASNGQSWSQSVFTALTAGSLTGLTVRNVVATVNSGGTSLSKPVNTAYTPTATLTRYGSTATTTDATTAYVLPEVLYLNYSSGASIDATFRVAMPQLELATSTTSPIATGGVATSRAADVYSVMAGTYTDSTGTLKYAPADTPRLTYETSGTGVPLGLLVEEARTNLAKYSDQFDQSNWTKTGTAISANGVAAPDGTSTADTLTESAVTSAHEIPQTITISAGSNLSISGYVKNVTGSRWIMLYATGASGFSFCHFDPSTGAVGTASFTGSYTAGTGTSWKLPNGWYRFSCQLTTATDTSVAAGFRLKTVNNGVSSYAGDGTSQVALWGAQVEASSFPTSYIPTQTATVTRSAENFSIPTSGGWYTAGLGTLGAIGMVPFLGISGSSWFFLATLYSAASDRILIRNAYNNEYQAAVTTGGVDQYNVLVLGYTAGGLFQGVIAFADNNMRAAFAGSTAALDTAGTIPTITSLQVGHSGGGNQLNGYVRRIWYMPTREPDASLGDYSR